MAGTKRSDNWGFPRWRPYGSSRDAVKVRETPRYAELFQHIWHSLGEEFVKQRKR